MKVYHGSISIIDRPIANAGRDRLDFSQAVIDEHLKFIESYKI